jgi:hypothetical protein
MESKSMSSCVGAQANRTLSGFFVDLFLFFLSSRNPGYFISQQEFRFLAACGKSIERLSKVDVSFPSVKELLSHECPGFLRVAVAVARAD